jgi:P-type E1-E2 ATPase
LRHLLSDFTGTLSRQGKLLPGVERRLRNLAKHLHITVATADTFGTARAALAGLPVKVVFVRTGADKARLVRKFGPANTVAIGNGCNDVAMLKSAALGLAVVGPEGTSARLLRVADVVFRDVLDALDALADPRFLKADLRP